MNETKIFTWKFGGRYKKKCEEHDANTELFNVMEIFNPMHTLPPNEKHVLAVFGSREIHIGGDEYTYCGVLGHWNCDRCFFTAVQQVCNFNEYDAELERSSKKCTFYWKLNTIKYCDE